MRASILDLMGPSTKPGHVFFADQPLVPRKSVAPSNPNRASGSLTPHNFDPRNHSANRPNHQLQPTTVEAKTTPALIVLQPLDDYSRGDAVAAVAATTTTAEVAAPPPPHPLPLPTKIISNSNNNNNHCSSSPVRPVKPTAAFVHHETPPPPVPQLPPTFKHQHQQQNQQQNQHQQQQQQEQQKSVDNGRTSVNCSLSDRADRPFDNLHQYSRQYRQLHKQLTRTSSNSITSDNRSSSNSSNSDSSSIKVDLLSPLAPDASTRPSTTAINQTASGTSQRAPLNRHRRSHSVTLSPAEVKQIITSSFSASPALAASVPRATSAGASQHKLSRSADDSRLYMSAHLAASSPPLVTGDANSHLTRSPTLPSARLSPPPQPTSPATVTSTPSTLSALSPATNKQPPSPRRAHTITTSSLQYQQTTNTGDYSNSPRRMPLPPVSGSISHSPRVDHLSLRKLAAGHAYAHSQQQQQQQHQQQFLVSSNSVMCVTQTGAPFVQSSLHSASISNNSSNNSSNSSNNSSNDININETLQPINSHQHSTIQSVALSSLPIVRNECVQPINAFNVDAKSSSNINSKRSTNTGITINSNRNSSSNSSNSSPRDSTSPSTRASSSANTCASSALFYDHDHPEGVTLDMSTRELVSTPCLRPGVERVVLTMNRLCIIHPGHLSMAASTLRMLDLSNNRLVTLPLDFGTLVNLTELYLGHNHLTELPSFISSLERLEVLDLGFNRLNELPVEMTALKRLQHLDLRNNNIKTVPAFLGELFESLERLLMAGNPLDKQSLTVLKPILSAAKSQKEQQKQQSDQSIKQANELGQRRLRLTSAPDIFSDIPARVKRGLSILTKRSDSTPNAAVNRALIISPPLNVSIPHDAPPLVSAKDVAPLTPDSDTQSSAGSSGLDSGVALFCAPGIAPQLPAAVQQSIRSNVPLIRPMNDAGIPLLSALSYSRQPNTTVPEYADLVDAAESAHHGGGFADIFDATGDGDTGLSGYNDDDDPESESLGFLSFLSGGGGGSSGGSHSKSNGVVQESFINLSSTASSPVIKPVSKLSRAPPPIATTTDKPAQSSKTHLRILVPKPRSSGSSLGNNSNNNANNNQANGSLPTPTSATSTHAPFNGFAALPPTPRTAGSYAGHQRKRSVASKSRYDDPWASVDFEGFQVSPLPPQPTPPSSPDIINIPQQQQQQQKQSQQIEMAESVGLNSIATPSDSNASSVSTSSSSDMAPMSTQHTALTRGVLIQLRDVWDLDPESWVTASAIRTTSSKMLPVEELERDAARADVMSISTDAQIETPVQQIQHQLGMTKLERLKAARRNGWSVDLDSLALSSKPGGHLRFGSTGSSLSLPRPQLTVTASNSSTESSDGEGAGLSMSLVPAVMPMHPSSVIGYEHSGTLTHLQHTMRTRRTAVISDLVKSEQLYVMALECIDQVYVQGALRTNALSAGDIAQLFGHVHGEILELHRTRILPELRSAGVASASALSIPIAGVLLKYMADLELLYLDQCDAFENGSSVLSTLYESSPARLERFFAAARRHPLHTGPNIQYYMLKLQERIGDYRTILERLRQFTTEDDPDYLCILAALEKLAGLLRAIEVERRNAGQRNRVRYIQDKLVRSASKLPLAIPTRRLLREGRLKLEVVVTAPHVRTSETSLMTDLEMVHTWCHVILFNDLLLVCSIRNKEAYAALKQSKNSLSSSNGNSNNAASVSSLTSWHTAASSFISTARHASSPTGLGYQSYCGPSTTSSVSTSISSLAQSAAAKAQLKQPPLEIMRPLWLNSKMEPASVMTESTSPIALWSPMARDIRLRIADRTGLYYFSADFPDSGTSAVAAAMLGRWAFAINNRYKYC